VKGFLVDVACYLKGLNIDDSEFKEGELRLSLKRREMFNLALSIHDVIPKIFCIFFSQ